MAKFIDNTGDEDLKPIPDYNASSSSDFYYDRELATREKTVRLYDFDTAQPIITGIISDSDYGFNISNNWGGNSTVIDTIINTVGGLLTGTTGKMVADTVDSIAGLFGLDKYTEGFKELANSKIYSASETIKAFNGTDIDFNGAGTIKTRFIHNPKSGKTVIDAVKGLLKYCVGFQPDDLLGLEQWIGVQFPPNGYCWSFDNISTTGRIKKTLSLFIGTSIRIDNLLVSKLSVNFSSQTIMSPGKINSASGYNHYFGEATNFPAFADVEISLEPARKISRRDILDMFTGGNTDVEGGTFNQKNNENLFGESREAAAKRKAAERAAQQSQGNQDNQPNT